jgi:glutamate--cysteine ligase
MTQQCKTNPVMETRADLVAYLEGGAKPPADWRIGTEHEKFGFRLGDKSRPAYEGPDGIRALLEGLQAYGWTPVREAGKIIALTLDGQNITLEPGGQLELSGAMLETLHQTCDEVHSHLKQIRAVSEQLGLGFIGLGMDPLSRRDQVPVMPKGRYDIMRRYMPTRGALGLDMMLRSCTVQVNLDFSSEADMVRKFQVSLALQPIATALFANSPFTEGRPNGFLSFRSHIWTDTDPDRTGMLPFVFEDGFGFERYADYALDVPMYFVYREGRYIDAAGQSFRDFLAGRLPALPGEKPRQSDWIDHLTTIFPEVRLKRFLEMRGADGGPWRRLCALPALWVGLLYDGGALDAAWDLVKDWTAEERETLRREVARQALKARFRSTSVQELARRVLAIASQGLKARARLDNYGDSEQHFINARRHIAERGQTPADALREAYHGRWKGAVMPIYDEYAY